MRTVALVDDHVVLRDALAKLIQALPGYEVLFCADNGVQFTRMLDPGRLPDVVLMDVAMPNMNGFETTLWITNHYPQIKVIVLSMHPDERTIIRMLRHGAKGYLLKATDADELRTAMQEVCTKGIYLNELLFKNLASSIGSNQLPTEEHEKQMAMELTERETLFLRFLCTEKSYKEIAAEMFLSPRTIDGYRDALFDKLKVNSRVGLVLFAIRNGIVQI